MLGLALMWRRKRRLVVMTRKTLSQEVTFEYENSVGWDGGWIDEEWRKPSKPNGACMMQHKYTVKVGLTAGAKHNFKFPARITLSYAPSKVYPGNSFRVDVGVQPLSKARIESSAGGAATLGYYSRERICVLGKCTPWGPWLGATAGVNVGVHIDEEDEKLPLGNEKLSCSDTQSTGFSIGEYVSVASVDTKTTLVFSDGKILISGLEIDGKESASLEWSSPGSKSVAIDVAPDAEPGDQMTLSIKGLHYRLAFRQDIGLYANLAGYECPEVPLYSKVLSEQTLPYEEDVAFTIDISDPVVADDFDVWRAVEDSWVNKKLADRDTNFGDSRYLALRSEGPHSDVKYAYIKFDVPQVGDFYSAELALHYCNNEGTNVLEVRPILTNWDEMEVTWNNRPDLGPAIDSKEVSGAEGTVVLDVTSHIKAKGTGIVELALAMPEGQRWMNVWSRECSDRACQPTLNFNQGKPVG
jgi:hypothetical protein